MPTRYEFYSQARPMRNFILAVSIASGILVFIAMSYMDSTFKLTPHIRAWNEDTATKNPPGEVKQLKAKMAGKDTLIRELITELKIMNGISRKEGKLSLNLSNVLETIEGSVNPVVTRKESTTTTAAISTVTPETKTTQMIGTLNDRTAKNEPNNPVPETSNKSSESGNRAITQEASTPGKINPAIVALKKNKNRLILQWNPSSQYYGKQPPKIYSRHGCGSCIFTNNRSRAMEADVILVEFPLFVGRNLTKFIENFPEKRPPNQLWAFYSKESAARLPLDYTPIDGLFNLTFTYRKDSDIWIPYSSFRLQPKDWIEKQKAKPKVNRAEGKTKLIAWAVSNCGAPTKRLDYAKELQKYVPVDIYGRCGNLTCKQQGDCRKMFGRDYKFYLAFENSICEDYATEKLFNNRASNLVPIVLGGYNYSSLPKDSVIDISQFNSVKDLADYLKKVDKNDDLYNKYFELEKKYKIYSGGGYCNLCAYLSNTIPDNFHKIYKMSDWWSAKRQCKTPYEYFNKGVKEELNLTKEKNKPYKW